MDEPLKLAIQATANPNTVKITVNRRLTDARRSFGSAAEAAGHPLARAILQLPGVQLVYMLGNFMTVTKARNADWRTIGPAIQVKVHQILK